MKTAIVMPSCVEQLKAIMADERWYSLATLATKTGYPPASVSARLRDLRKTEYGGYTVLRRAFKGVFQYRLLAQREFRFGAVDNPRLRHRCKGCGGKGYKVCGRGAYYEPSAEAGR